MRKRRATSWETARAVAVTLAASVAVLGSVAAVAISAHGYFAKQTAVNRMDRTLQCLDQLMVEALDLTSEANVAYQAYVNAKANWLALKSGNLFPYQDPELGEHEYVKRQLDEFGRATALDEKSRKLRERYEKECRQMLSNNTE